MAGTEAAQRVDRVLAAIGAGYLTVAELARAAGCSTSTVRLRLHARYEAGEIDADRSGFPYRYRLTPGGSEVRQ